MKECQRLSVFLFAAVLTIFPSWLAADEAPKTQRRVKVFGLTQGTSFSVIAYGLPDTIGEVELQRLVRKELTVIDGQLSNWNPESEISRFNSYRETEWFPVSETTGKVVAAGLLASQRSDGAFDMSVAPLVDLWGFGSKRAGNKLPSAPEIEKAKQLVGWEKLEVRQSPAAIRKSKEGVQIDLAGIAQGYSVDRLATVLKRAGASSFLVEIGGEDVAIGFKPDGTPWRIGIERPDDSPSSRNALQTIIPLTNQAVATSGDYRRFREIKGTRYSHTIDPRTGRPITHDLASVTIVADTCMKADALSTTMMVLGPSKGYEWAVQHNVAAMFVIREDAQFTVKETPSFTKIEKLSVNDLKDEISELFGKPVTLNRSLWRAVVLGLVEGSTEYLPVSSTGHLLLVQALMEGTSSDESKRAEDALAICIQSGAILAVLVLYRRRFQQMFRGMQGNDSEGRQLFLHLVVAFLPSAILGLLLHAWIKEHLFGVRPVIAALFVGGVLILSASKSLVLRGQSSGIELNQLTWKASLLIGLAQCCAFFPGFSRSLATILGGLWSGLSLAAAVEFSFLLGLVTLSAATLFEGLDNGAAIFEHYGAAFPFVALVSAFISAVLSIKFMIKLLNSHGLMPFGYYRIVLALICIAVFW